MARIPRSLHSAVLRVLRPAESALRRLIVIEARGLVVKPAPSRPMPAGPITGKGGGNSRAFFQLFDPRKNFAAPHRRVFARIAPRIHIFGSDPRVAALWSASQPAADPAPPPDGLVNAATPHPEASGPKARARGSAAPGPASRPLAVETGERKNSKVQVAAPAGPSARLPQEAGSRSR